MKNLRVSRKKDKVDINVKNVYQLYLHCSLILFKICHVLMYSKRNEI